MKVRIVRRIHQTLSIEVEVDTPEEAEALDDDDAYSEHWDEAHFHEHEEPSEFEVIK